MTTIACRDGLMAADSQATEDGLVTRTHKLYRVKSAIIGGAGCPYSTEAFALWWADKRKSKPDLDDDWEAIVMERDKVTFWNSKLQSLRVAEPYAAIGSGATAALVAMDLGASAAEAVEAAAKRDAHSSGPFQVMKL